jgi:hypothetical protein
MCKKRFLPTSNTKKSVGVYNILEHVYKKYDTLLILYNRTWFCILLGKRDVNCKHGSYSCRQVAGLNPVALSRTSFLVSSRVRQL